MLRQLQEKDAQNMASCMNDENVNCFMKISERKSTVEGCLDFIKKSLTDKENLHFAIVDDNDDWIGTISLKNINKKDKSAEYAIITSKNVHGKGFAKTATEELLNFAFDKLDLNRIYLNVVEKNLRAIKFYEKMGFKPLKNDTEIQIRGENYVLKWFEIKKHH